MNILLKLLLLAFLIHSASLFSSEAQLEELQSVYIFKFSNYIVWPGSKNTSLKIGVLNNRLLLNKLDEGFKKNASLMRQVKIIPIENQKNDLSEFSIVIIDTVEALKNNKYENIVSNGVFLITHDKAGIKEGVMLNFFVDAGGRLRFEIDNNQAALMGIKINSRLLNLAKSSK